MTDKEFVLSIYPNATVDPTYFSGYSVYWFEKGDTASVTSGNDEDVIWRKMREYLERKMLRKLEL